MDAATQERINLWLDGNYDDEAKAEIKRLQTENEGELINSFYRNMEFGTGGLRGTIGVGTNRMNKYTVGMATQGLANYLLSAFKGEKITVVIAYDSRRMSPEFARVAAEIFAANGIKVFMFKELRPTPELSFAVRELGCQAGVVITASHNPKEYNGYKVYWDDGGQIISPHDKNIIAEVNKISSIEEVKWNGNGSLIEILGDEIDNKYLENIKSLSVNPDAIEKTSDVKIVYTALHGAGITQVPKSLEKYGFKNVILVEEQSEPDKDFSTVRSPNPEEREALTLAIKKGEEIGADLVLGTDPDCDRVGIAIKDLNGKISIINGNQTGALLTYYMINAWKEKGKLAGKEYIVKTVVTTELIADIAKKYNVAVFDTLTGFKYIADIIKQYEGKMQFIVGGEESYGYLAGEFVRDKDAVIASSLLAEMTAWVKSKGMSLYDLLIDMYLQFGFYKERLVSVKKEGKSGEEEIKQMMSDFHSSPPGTINGSKVTMIKDYQSSVSKDTISGKEEKIDLPKSNVLQFFTEDRSKITARPSGTEPKIKFYISVYEKLPSKDDFNATDNLLEERINSILKDMNVG
ncbi:phospho-sugar mutase [Spirochaetota bacterium]